MRQPSCAVLVKGGHLEGEKADEILKTLSANGILGGLPLGDGKILWCATEMNTKEEMDRVAAICKEVTGA